MATANSSTELHSSSKMGAGSPHCCHAGSSTQSRVCEMRMDAASGVHVSSCSFTRAKRQDGIEVCSSKCADWVLRMSEVIDAIRLGRADVMDVPLTCCLPGPSVRSGCSVSKWVERDLQ